jgi:hypothetical protein
MSDDENVEFLDEPYASLENVIIGLTVYYTANPALTHPDIFKIHSILTRPKCYAKWKAYMPQHLLPAYETVGKYCKNIFEDPLEIIVSPGYYDLDYRDITIINYRLTNDPTLTNSASIIERCTCKILTQLADDDELAAALLDLRLGLCSDFFPPAASGVCTEDKTTKKEDSDEYDNSFDASD